MRAKKLLLKLGLFAGSIFFTLLLLELGARFLNAARVINVNMPDPPYNAYDHELGWDLKKNFPPTEFTWEGITYEIWTNELGCFENPYKGEDYILAIGDSFTFHAAPFENKWSKRVERDLGQRTLNCGVGGYGTKNELEKARRVISAAEKRPKLIVVGYFLNDFDDDMVISGLVQMFKGQEDRKQSFASAPFRLKDWLYRNSVLYGYSVASVKSFAWKIPLAENILRSLNIVRGDPKNALSVFDTYFWGQKEEGLARWQEHLQNIRAFKDFTDENEVQLLFVIIPWKFQVYDFMIADRFPDPQKREEYTNYPNELLHKAFDESGIAYVDLLPPLRQYADLTPREFLNAEKDLYYRIDGHWSPKGNELAGTLVAKYILENNLLSVPDKEEKLQDIEKELQSFYSKN